jgi:peptidyl-tRNA hydrolase
MGYVGSAARVAGSGFGDVPGLRDLKANFGRVGSGPGYPYGGGPPGSERSFCVRGIHEVRDNALRAFPVSVAQFDNVLDTGCVGGHMTGDLSLFRGRRHSRSLPITGVDSASTLHTDSVGSGVIMIEGQEWPLEPLFYVPGLQSTLLSVRQLLVAKPGMQAVFTADGVSLCPRTPSMGVFLPSASGCWSVPQSSRRPAGKGAEASGGGARPYGYVTSVKTSTFMKNTFTGKIPFAALVHNRFGHVSLNNTHVRSAMKAAFGAQFDDSEPSFCKACVLAKMHRQVSREPPRRPARRPLERVHFDLSPAIPVEGMGGYVGYLVLVDEFTEMIWCKLIRRKSDVQALLAEFKSESENHFQVKMEGLARPHTLACFRSDNAGENTSQAVKDWCAAVGVRQELSAPYEQWQNGMAERAIKTVWQGSEAMRKAASAPARYWPHSLLAFVHARNRLPTSASPKSPFERWWDIQVPLERRIQHLRTWGSRCFLLVPKECRRKLDDLARECLFLGYAPRTKGYVCLELSSGKIFVGASVVFDETSFPCASSSWPTTGVSEHWALMPAIEWPSDAPEAVPPVPTVGEAMEDQPLGSTPAVTPVFEAWGDVLDGPAAALEVPAVAVTPVGPGVPPEAELWDSMPSLELPDYGLPVLPLPSGDQIVGAAAPLPSGDQFVGVDVPMADLDGPRRSSRVRAPLPVDQASPPPVRARPVRAEVMTVVPDPVGVVDGRAAWEIASVHRHRMGREIMDDGSESPYVVLQYEVQYAGMRAADREWLVEADIGESSKLLQYKAKERASMAVLRKRFPGQVKGVDYVPAVLDPPLPSGDEVVPQAELQALTAQVTQFARRATMEQALLDGVSPSSVPCVDRLGRPVLPTVLPHVSVIRRLRAQLMQPVVLRRQFVRLQARLSKVETVHDGVHLLALAATAEAKFRPTMPPPLTVRAAREGINAPGWEQAMRDEFESFGNMGVWKLVPPPPGKNVMKCKWIFAIKTLKDGTLDKLKARLTACGYSQSKGQDFDETYAPTCRMRTFRMLMVEAATVPGFKTAQWDCKCAFLQADADHEMYMRQPPGWEVPGQEFHVYRLLKSVYGTKQASRLFSLMVKRTLLRMGATVAAADECLYTWAGPDGLLRILVHVDDFACTYTDVGLYERVLAEMTATFVGGFKDMGELSYFLGIAVERQDDGTFRLHQQAYIEELLDRLAGQVPLLGAASPEASGTAGKLRKQDGPLPADEALFMETVSYKSAVAGLFYLSRSTRWDITHAVAMVAKYMTSPNRSHWTAVMRIYAYLRRTKAVALRVGGGAAFTITAAADADWAGDVDTRKSHSGWMVHCANTLVAWMSKGQRSIAQSTTEAELMSLTSCANEVLWWRTLLQDLGYTQEQPSKIYEDNTAAVTLATHSGRFEATKHIHLKHLLCRDYIERKLIDVCWIPTENQPADVLTKNVLPKDFRRIVSSVMREAV